MSDTEKILLRKAREFAEKQADEAEKASGAAQTYSYHKGRKDAYLSMAGILKMGEEATR